MTILFTWNVVLLCIYGTFIGFAVVGAFMAIIAAAGGGASGITPNDSNLPKGVTYKTVYGYGDNEILSIPINGVILGTDDSGGSLASLFGSGQTYGYDVKDQLYAAAHDDRIKAVVLEVDSPGGTIYGSRAIADGVAYYKSATHNPVYTHIEGVGASGAYWASSSADKVYADDGSEVGSIGVIMGPFEYYNTVLSEDSGLLGGGVVTQNGIQSVTITAGRSKDIGSPYRKLTAQEIQTLQQSVNNEYDGFVGYVSKHRGIPEDTIRNTIGAMIYDPKTALDLKLIDGSSSRDGTYDALAQAAGIQGNYQVIREQYSAGLVSALVGAVTHKVVPTATFDTCSLTQVALAYHGDTSSWCAGK